MHLLKMAAVFAVLATPALADAPLQGNASEGAKVARDICTTCHYVAYKQDVEPVWKDSLPSFMVVAQRPGLTEEQIVGFLTSTHASSANLGGMPKVGITPREARDVAAYIMTLRRP